jgi:cytochrome bd ubiquinol oxidase subunit II
MEAIWYILVALMLAGYVVLDGFDLGAGALHLILARTDEERQLVLRSIGPVWDGNEVWLLAGGGTLFYAFPMLYASSFSGLYLPLIIVLWLLVLRALGIEFRSQFTSPVWRDFFDGMFSLASLLLIIFFGAALGNVLRGVPLDANHVFFVPLWTNFQVGADPGVLDWYTVLAALVAVAALAVHGALYLAVKNEGVLQERARRVVRVVWPALLALTVVGLVATLSIRPEYLRNYYAQPVGWLLPLLVAASLGGMRWFLAQGQDRNAFRASCGYILGVLGGAAYGLFPTLLPSSGAAANSITAYNAAAGAHSLSIGLIWWAIGMAIVVGYFTFIYRMFGGKVRAGGEQA